MRIRTLVLTLLLAAAGTGGCSMTHRAASTGKLAAARAAVQNAEMRGEYTGTARTDLDAAHYYLQQAEEAGTKPASREAGNNFAYAAEQLASAAIARRESMLLLDKEAREREAKMALHRAETAELEAERARKLAQPSP